MTLKGVTCCFGLNGLTETMVPEIKVRYNRGRKFLGKISGSSDVAAFLHKTYGRGQIQMQERFVVLYLNPNLEILGYYKHTVGTINEVLIDMRIVFATALASLSVGIIIAHNHPSGNPKPSEIDKKVTKQFVEAGKLLEIRIVDHLILTKDSYFSFADAGLLHQD